MYTNNIKGWMSKEELQWLHNQSLKMNSIVEIGSWYGRSTHALVSGCNGNVYAIDTWSPEDMEAKYKGGEEVYKSFINNMKEFNNMVVKRNTSEKASEDFTNQSIDMVFIDGNHSYSGVKQDIILWKDKAKKIICGHDYDFKEVKQVVDEIFNKVDICGSIWYVNL